MGLKKKQRYTIYTIALILLSAWGIYSFKHRQLVHVGDSESKVFSMLGNPQIEFPIQGGTIQWFSGYEITVTNGIVSHVKRKPVLNKEERTARKEQAEIAERELYAAYRAAARVEEVSFKEWKRRQAQQLKEKQAQQERVELYKKRQEKKKNQSNFGCRY